MLEHFLETRVVILDIPDGFSQINLKVVVILVFEYPSLRNITILDQRLMDILFRDEEAKIDVKHDSSIGNENMFHIIVLI